MAGMSESVLGASGTKDIGDLKMRSSHAHTAAQPLARCERLRRRSVSLSVSYRVGVGPVGP